MGMSVGNLIEYARHKQEQRNDDVETFWKGIRLVCWHIAHYAGKTLKDGSELDPSDIVELPSDKKQLVARQIPDHELITMIDQWQQDG